MRTTIDIPDALYRRLKARAAREGQSAKSLILRGVEHVLAPQLKAPGHPVSLPIVRAKRPASITLDNARIYDVISFP